MCDEDTQRCDSLGPLFQESFLPATSEERGHQGHLCGQGQTRAELHPSAAVKSADGSPGLMVLLGRTYQAPPCPGPRAPGCGGAKDHLTPTPGRTWGTSVAGQPEMGQGGEISRVLSGQPGAVGDGGAQALAEEANWTPGPVIPGHYPGSGAGVR